MRIKTEHFIGLYIRCSLVLYSCICLRIFIQFQTIITREYIYKAAETYNIGLEVDDQTKHDENENGIYYMERP